MLSCFGYVCITITVMITPLQTTVQDAKLHLYKLIRTYCSWVFLNCHQLSFLSFMKNDIKNIKNIKKGKRGSQIVLLLLVVLSATALGTLPYNYDNMNNNNLQLLSLPLLPPVQASVLNTSSLSNNVPIGSNITVEDISKLASLFNDQPFQGGQVSPRVAKWVNDDVFVFLQFDERSPSNATAINYIGIGKRGTFCEEDRPNPDFVHFHKWNATEYKHGHGSEAGEEGYWLMWVATGEFDVQGRHVKPGVDREFSPTPPPPKCDGSI
jgi:hypothetical protein